ncbi:MAG: YciI family protein [Myxococcales bacterium]|nr:YciI family protein [Myxococcales bacterium]
MKYLMLLRGDEAAWSAMPEPQREAAIAAYMQYNADLAEAGVLAGGAQLKPSFTATTLREVDGEVALTDGPYAETREHIGGFYVLEVPDLDTALSWARRCPALRGGSIEVRPLGTEPAELDDA